MGGLFSGLIFFALDALAIVLLVAIWQRTRITGFVLVAASVGLGIVLRWLTPWVYRSVDLAEAPSRLVAVLVIDGLYAIAAAIAVLGFWNIYRRLAPPRAAAPPA